MRRAVNLSARLFSEIFRPVGPVVELGSFYTPAYQALSDLRPYFPDQEYIGCDIRRGPGVDLIEDAQNLSFPDKSVGTLLMFELLEHLPQPQKAIAEARRVLNDDGVLALSVPFHYRLHGFPSDYWRFTASGIHTLLSAFPQKTVFAAGPRLKPAFIFAVAAKTASTSFAEKRKEFESQVVHAFRQSRLRGHLSIFKERAKDFWGHLLGRAEVSVIFFEPNMKGGYLSQQSSDDARKQHGQTEKPV